MSAIFVGEGIMDGRELCALESNLGVDNGGRNDESARSIGDRVVDGPIDGNIRPESAGLVSAA
jgi:hypothetical protein